jgi:hypothetical protein
MLATAVVTWDRTFRFGNQLPRSRSPQAQDPTD